MPITTPNTHVLDMKVICDLDDGDGGIVVSDSRNYNAPASDIYELAVMNVYRTDDTDTDGYHSNYEHYDLVELEQAVLVDYIVRLRDLLDKYAPEASELAEERGRIAVRAKMWKEDRIIKLLSQETYGNPNDNV